ncbi:MAG: RNA-binding protein [Calditrichia bacterium]
MNIYVGNLPADATAQDLREAFEQFGMVESAVIIKDKYSGESRGFGFVEMKITTEAEAAIKNVDGKELKGRYLIVNEARPRKEKRRGKKGGGRSGGFRRY